jgi:hypothetical protein
LKGGGRKSANLFELPLGKLNRLRIHLAFRLRTRTLPFGGLHVWITVNKSERPKKSVRFVSSTQNVMAEQDFQRLVHLVPQTNQIRALHTIIRDKHTKRGDFVFYSDRLIRLLIEEGLGLLPFTDRVIETPVGLYQGAALFCFFGGIPQRPGCCKFRHP